MSVSKQKPLIIFDWDGTIIDSADKIIGSMQLASRDLGLAEPASEAVRNIIGLGLPESIYQLHDGIDEGGMFELRDQYSKRFVEADTDPCPFFPGVEETLDELKSSGYRLAVATGKSRRGMTRVFDNLDWHDKFDGIRCADETASKPDPRMLHELSEIFSVAKDEALMIGDTVFDLEMAQNAEIQSVGVSYGAHSVERLRRHNPIAIVDAFDDLIKVIEHWEVRERN